MRLSISKTRKLEVVGTLPSDLNGEFEVTIKVWAVGVEKPIKQNEGDDVSEILKVVVVDGLAKI